MPPAGHIPPNIDQVRYADTAMPMGSRPTTAMIGTPAGSMLSFNNHLRTRLVTEA